jgi:DNA-binding NarL/FixJ family response regulator
MERYGIVLADDHTLIRHGLKRIIEENTEMEVVGEAGDGLELLEILNSLHPHMVVLDMSMPKLRGLEAISEIKLKHPSVKILILSMHKEYVFRALSSGIDGYLLKEDASRELFLAIDRIRQGGKYLSHSLGELVAETLYDKNFEPVSEPLSAREREVLKLVADGKTNKEISQLLSISVRTVEGYRAHIMSKLDVKNTAELVKYAIQKGYA